MNMYVLEWGGAAERLEFEKHFFTWTNSVSTIIQWVSMSGLGGCLHAVNIVISGEQLQGVTERLLLLVEVVLVHLLN